MEASIQSSNPSWNMGQSNAASVRLEWFSWENPSLMKIQNLQKKTFANISVETFAGAQDIRKSSKRSKILP
jgi:hypothetical protein